MNKPQTLPFLLAMPALEGSFFDSALILLIEHDDQGAWGLMLNQPSKLNKTALLKTLNPNIETKPNQEQTLYIGGPVDAEHGFILHEPCRAFEGEQMLTDTLAISCRQSLLQAHAHGANINDKLIAFGYCGWSQGQLEQEIKANSWLQVPCDINAVLQKPYDERLHTVLAELGIKYQQLSSMAGHS